MEKDTSWLEPRRPLLRWGFWFSGLNAPLLALLAARCLGFAGEVDGVLANIYLPLAVAGHFISLAYAPYLGLLLPLIILKVPRKIIFGLAVAIFSLGLVILWLDTVVYALYRFHFNLVVLHLVFGGAARDIFHLSWMTYLTTIVALLGLLGLETLLARLVWRRLVPCLGLKAVLVAVLVGVLTNAGGHFIHAWAHAVSFRPVTSLTRHIPFYFPLMAREHLVKFGLVDLEKARQAQDLKPTAKSSGDLLYPINPLTFQDRGPRLNLLFILLDAWRFDMLTPEVTPNIYRFWQEVPVWRFREHFSGGAGTREGVFSLFYGLPASYWGAMQANRREPVLMREVLRRGYDFGVFATAYLSSPEFDQTVFAEVPNLLLRAEDETGESGDREALGEWLKWLDRRDKSKPFFGFLFFDSAHAYYLPRGYPPRFEPMWERVDHLALKNGFDPTPYLNRYKTCLYYVDSLVGRLLADLKQRGLLETTLVIITSDHGEEFNENKGNFWGHGSNFTKWQTQVPLLIHWPGRPAAEFRHRTSHLDLAPTLMKDLFGCLSPASDFSSGRHLLETSPRPYLIFGPDFNLAIKADGQYVVTFYSTYEVFDEKYRTIKSPRLNYRVLDQALRETSRFYR